MLSTQSERERSARFHAADAVYLVTADKQGYQQSYDAALVGADRSKDIVVLRLLNLQVGCAQLHGCELSQAHSIYIIT